MSEKDGFICMLTSLMPWPTARARPKPTVRSCIQASNGAGRTWQLMPLPLPPMSTRRKFYGDGAATQTQHSTGEVGVPSRSSRLYPSTNFLKALSYNSDKIWTLHHTPLSLVKLSNTPMMALMQSSTALPTWFVTFWWGRGLLSPMQMLFSARLYCWISSSQCCNALEKQWNLHYYNRQQKSYQQTNLTSTNFSSSKSWNVLTFQ